MSEAALSARSLSCGYPGRTVLSDVSLEIRSGEIIALLGQNGSGKTTLLKTLCGSLPPVSGSVNVATREIGQLGSKELAQLIAYVPQEERSDFAFSVREVVTMGRLPLSATFFDSEEDRLKATEAMRTADCLHLADRSIQEISAGERQRVILARALAQEAKIILLDEPTAHLDLGHQLEVSTLLKRLAQAGYVIVLAVHDLQLAARTASRGLVLEGGRVMLDARFSDVLESSSLDVAYSVTFRRLKDPDLGTVLVPLTTLAPSGSEAGLPPNP
ncbi:MAG: ABC transporter ATP-binding protein [Fimbriimonadaceae bacterium]|nr:ABC transporter ATP-binding protein [Fimbriimonadaceae bacterium]